MPNFHQLKRQMFLVHLDLHHGNVVYLQIQIQKHLIFQPMFWSLKYLKLKLFFWNTFMLVITKIKLKNPRCFEVEQYVVELQKFEEILLLRQKVETPLLCPIRFRPRNFFFKFCQSSDPFSAKGSIETFPLVLSD